MEREISYDDRDKDSPKFVLCRVVRGSQSISGSESLCAAEHLGRKQWRVQRKALGAIVLSSPQSFSLYVFTVKRCVKNKIYKYV